MVRKLNYSILRKKSEEKFKKNLLHSSHSYPLISLVQTPAANISNFSPSQQHVKKYPNAKDKSIFLLNGRHVETQVMVKSIPPRIMDITPKTLAASSKPSTGSSSPYRKHLSSVSLGGCAIIPHDQSPRSYV